MVVAEVFRHELLGAGSVVDALDELFGLAVLEDGDDSGELADRGLIRLSRQTVTA